MIPFIKAIKGGNVQGSKYLLQALYLSAKSVPALSTRAGENLWLSWNFMASISLKRQASEKGRQLLLVSNEIEFCSLILSRELKEAAAPASSFFFC